MSSVSLYMSELTHRVTDSCSSIIERASRGKLMNEILLLNIAELQKASKE